MFFLNRFVTLARNSPVNQNRYIGILQWGKDRNVWTVPIVPRDHSLQSLVGLQLKTFQTFTAFSANLVKRTLTSTTKLSAWHALCALQGKQSLRIARSPQTVSVTINANKAITLCHSFLDVSNVRSVATMVITSAQRNARIIKRSVPFAPRHALMFLLRMSQQRCSFKGLLAPYKRPVSHRRHKVT